MRVLIGEPAVGGDPVSVYDAVRTAPPARPWLLANMVAGLDGAASFRGRVGELSTSTNHALFAHLRSFADVVLVGAGTVRAERYGPVRLTAAEHEARRRRGMREVPPIAVVSGSLQFDFEAPLFATDQPARPLLITAESAGAAALERAASHADVIVAGAERVDLAAALREMRERGHETVLTEGGPALLGELVDASLLDELCLTITPAMGGDPLTVATTTAGGFGGRGGPGREGLRGLAAGPPSIEELTRFELASVLEHDGDLFLRYLTVRA